MAEKEVRFRKLVDTSGRPEIVSLWADPKRDRHFMKAVKEHRVLTIIQEPRSHKKQFGRPGFHQGPFSSYLVFPKPLPVDPESRVIGISYELAATGITHSIRKTESHHARPKIKKTAPIEKTFTVLLRRTGVVETSLQVQARNLAGAEQKALERVRTEPFDGSKAIIKNQVVSVQQ